MTFYIGQKKAGEIFIGGKKIGRIYLGQTLVHMTAVVSKPTFLDYVIFDGASWIDSGVYGDQNTKIETEILISTNNVDGFVYGSRSSGTSNLFSLSITLYDNSLHTSNGTVYAGFAQTNNSNLYDTANKQEIYNNIKNKITTSHSIDGFFINGTKYLDMATSADFTTPSPIMVGAIHSFGSIDPRKFIGRYYRFKIYKNNVLAQDLRPCIDPKGVVCMYDMVAKKYLYNQGTGELKAGGRFVESIVFDGASYIDTGISQQTCTVECGIKFANADTRQLMGFHSSNGGYWGCRNTSGRYEASGGLLNTTVSALDYNDVTIDFDCNDSAAPSVKVTVKDATASVVGTAVFTARIYTIGALLNSNTVDSFHMTGQVYYNKFYIGGELVQDLRPYVDSNGVACFKDLVTDTLFYNKGTGTLTYTE